MSTPFAPTPELPGDDIVTIEHRDGSFEFAPEDRTPIGNREYIITHDEPEDLGEWV